MQTVMANLESFMVDLQSLVDSYVIVNQDPVTQDIVGRQLDSKILSALMMQASGTDLGKLDPNSNVYVLDTVPQTIVEDNPGAQQYSVYDISGDMIGQFNYAEAGAWAINIGDGRVVVLGPNGYPGSTLLLDAQNRALLSGLGVPNALGPVRNRKNRGLQKISKTAGLSDPFNDPGGCASSCFLMQQALQGKKDPRQAGRCVLCHDRQQ
jgi:hypothetical protein